MEIQVSVWEFLTLKGENTTKTEPDPADIGLKNSGPLHKNLFQHLRF